MYITPACFRDVLDADRSKRSLPPAISEYTCNSQKNVASCILEKNIMDGIVDITNDIEMAQK